MKNIFLDKANKKPIYRQIADAIIFKINSGEIQLGDQIPSINEFSQNYSIAKETVVKAFKILQEKKLIKSTHGKGYFISRTETTDSYKIMLIIDRFSTYKQMLFSQILKEFGPESEVNIFFHHFNQKVLKSLIKDNLGEYSHYILIPFEHPEIEESLTLLPEKNTYLIDIQPKKFKRAYCGVHQDFENDIYNILNEIKPKTLNYKSLQLINHKRDKHDIPSLISKGFTRFCKENKIQYNVIDAPQNYEPQKGTGYIVVDDNDLVDLIIQCNKTNLKPVIDIGIISYNESPLKQVISTGISVISTDFIQMGTIVAKMLKEGRHECIKNPFLFVDRGSF